MESPGTILYYLKRSTEFLEKKSVPNPRLDAEILLADLLAIKRIELYSKFDMPLNPKEESEYRERIVQRGKFRPVAYIIGKKGFYHSEFFVNEHVLIPRPETEELVELASKGFLNTKSNLRVLDLGTGSGCIGLSLALENPNHHYLLSDISLEAIEVARSNAKKNNFPLSSMEFVQSDLFAEVSGRFDLIVSNPPYIPIEEKETLMPDVSNFEPHLALFVEDFEKFHWRFLSEAKDKLNPGGLLLIETHPEKGNFLLNTAGELGYEKPELILDYSNKIRFFKASNAKERDCISHG